MRTWEWKGVVLLLLVGLSWRPALALQEVPPKNWLSDKPILRSLHKEHTSIRSRRGLKASTLSQELCRDAQKHADWMASTGRFEHSDMPYWEVILMGPPTPAGALQGWMESSAHREILMGGGEIGFGHAVANGKTYWVGMVR